MNKIKLRSILFIIFLCAIKFVLGEIAMASPIPDEVKSVVVFVFIEKEGKLIPNGTAFFIGVKNPSKPSTYSIYLVTAKHVLYKPDTEDFLENIFIRLNKKDGSSEVKSLPINASGKSRNVYTHTDPSVDIAVIPCLPDQKKFDFKFLPDDLVTTKEDYIKLKIREGSDVFFTGLFTPYPGSEKNYPIVRFGRVALVTDEKIDWSGKQMSLYLIEASSFGGNSGSPVFFYLGSDREPGSLVVGTPLLKLAGIMQGTFQDAQKIKVVETKKTPISLSSMGIAAVVPAYKLHELLFSDELKLQRGLK